MHGCADASMAARTLLRICTTSVSGQSWQIWRRIHAVLGFWDRGSVSAAHKHVVQTDPHMLHRRTEYALPELHTQSCRLHAGWWLTYPWNAAAW